MNKQKAIIEINRNEFTVYNGIDRVKIVRNETQLNRIGTPIVKWAGGKQWLAISARHLLPPNGYKGYFEPFVGGGSLYFAIAPNNAILIDKNLELITTYRAVKTDVERVIKILSKYQNGKINYYLIRSSKPRTLFTIAARILYLNKTCWNGLYRVNKRGEFNTPFGNYKNRKIYNSKILRDASKILQTSQLIVGDFEKVLSKAQKEDFVYFDPPYVTGHQNNGFLKYNKQLFSWNDQERLAKVAIKLVNKNVNVLISNADYPAVISLYKGFYYYKVSRLSLISSKSETRGKITEALLSSYPILNIKSEVI